MIDAANPNVLEVPIDASLAQVIASLTTMKLDRLRTEWRRRLGVEPPSLQSTELTRRFLAENLQLAVHGHDLELDRRLARLARDYRAGRSPPSKGRRLGPGAVLVKVWKGERHQVEVTAGGFQWRGRAFDSLSSVAREITGTRWNGPRFFGLREAS